MFKLKSFNNPQTFEHLPSTYFLKSNDYWGTELSSNENVEYQILHRQCWSACLSSKLLHSTILKYDEFTSKAFIHSTIKQ